MDLNGNKDTDTVQVALRIRPLVESELSRGCIECVEVFSELQQVQVKDLRFTYNHVFAPHVGQQEFYDVGVKNLISKLFQGYNVTILAYGQTGSGKTYSMGTNYSSDHDGNSQGIIPQAVADIFDYVDAHEKEFIFKISVSFMELYQEQCYDLLANKPRSHSIVEIREDHTGVILPGLTEKEVNSSSDTIMHLIKGSEGRAVGATAMNSLSSRSHAVFTIYIYKESREDKNNATTSKFHLVDLAGSERSKKTKATGDRLKEGIKINQGLLALGNVISALGDGTNRGFISYRDSKLTRLLQDSLGGNSVTLMIACISPADYNLEETVSTLRYADRARRIKNKPVVNQDAKAAEITRLNKIVNELRLQLMGKAPVCDNEAYTQLQEKYDKLLMENHMIAEKHKKVTNLLTTMLQEQTNMCEKALLAEAAKEKMERKLLELTEKCNQTLEFVNESNLDKSGELKESLIDCVKDMKSKLEELRTDQLTCDSELNQHDLRLSGNPIQSDGNTYEDEENIVQQEAHAFESAKLNAELHALNQAMALKAELVRQITVSTNELAVRNENFREDVSKVAQLEKERDELMQQLRNAKTKSKDPVDENRRKRVAALEEEISVLKKQCQQQASIIKVKEQNEAKIRLLTNEIQSMKATKVQLVKRMRAESEQFRRWKLESERNMCRLKAEDSKRRFAMQRMEAMHEKQHNVLKRKMEQAVAVNKRLKEALDKQKAVQLKRSKSNNKAEAVVNWLDQELEMMISTVHAEKTLEDLMEDRGLLTAELERIRAEGVEENATRIAQLQDDLALRNAQISDMQRRILAADQENKARSRWDSVQSMQEAKSAMKHLFDNLVETKKEVQWQKWDKNEPIKQLQDELDQIKKENEDLQKKYSKSRLELGMVEKNYEEKVSALLGVKVGFNGQPASQITLLGELQRKNEQLMAELEELKNKSGAPIMKQPAPPQKSKQLKVTKVEYSEPEDDDYLSDYDDDKDPDYRLTPMYKRAQAKRSSRLTMNFTLDQNRSKSSGDERSSGTSVSTAAVKRASDGTSRCLCRGSCASKHCGCVKAESKCGQNCRCLAALCKNRCIQEEENKENLSVKSELEDSKESDSSKYPSLLGTSSVKKRKFFFFKNKEDSSDNINSTVVLNYD